MKNRIICQNCGEENNIYELNCRHCKTYLRARVVNIDFWSVFGRLIESPVSAFKQIIFAEHKNLILPVMLFISFKFSLLIYSLLNAINPANIASSYYYLLIAAGLIIIAILLNSVISAALSKSIKIGVRWKDSLAISVYSFAPLLFSLAFLFPVEFALFGNHFLTFNPSPFVLKETAAYAIFGFEASILLWCFILYAVGIYAQSGRIIFSVFSSLLFIGLIFSVIFSALSLLS